MLSLDEWFNAVCESYLNPPVIVDGKILPAFPSDAIQANTTGQSGIDTLKDAFIFSEDACASWMKEFNRLVVPGGMLALTTRGRPFFDFCESLQGKGHAGYLGALSEMFDDFAHARALYDQGEFVHSNREGVTGGGA